MSQFIEMFGNPLSSIQKNELKKLGDCCQINPRRPSVSISDSDLVSFVPMPAVNEDGYIDGATNEEYGTSCNPAGTRQIHYYQRTE